MKKLLLTALSVLAVSTGYAEEVSTTVPEAKSYSYYYANGLLPTIGVGYRNRIDQTSAIDISVEVSTVVVFSRSLANLKFLNYYNPKNYVGFGLSAGAISWSGLDDYGRSKLYSAVLFAPTITKGWESKDSFLEINMYFPTITSVGNTLIPSFSISKGWKF